jgi:hypothetical protein
VYYRRGWRTGGPSDFGGRQLFISCVSHQNWPRRRRLVPSCQCQPAQGGSVSAEILKLRITAPDTSCRTASGAKVEVSCRHRKAPHHRRRASSALCRTQLMKCLTRPQICPTAAFASVGTTGLARPLHRHHLVRPWFPRVPREVSISIHMQMQPRNGIYSVGLLHHFSANRLCSQEPAAT